MSAFIQLLKLRLYDVLRSRSSASFVLLFPVALLLVVGLVFQQGHPFETKTVVVVGERGEGKVAQSLIDPSLREGILVETLPSEAEALGKLRARMVSAIVYPTKSNEPTRIVVTARDRLFGQGLSQALPSSTVSVVLAPRWGYVHYLFPGIVTFSVMLSGLFATGHTMVLFRQNRFLKKLATTPISKMSFIAAQIAARSVLVLAQVALLFVTAYLAFGVPFSLPAVFFVLATVTTGLLAFMGIGFVLACLIKTDDLVVDLISAVNLPLVFLSEIFFPLDALPRVLARIGEYLPSTQMVRLLRAVLLYGAEGGQAFGLEFLVMGAWVLASFALSLRLFRWHG